MFRTEASSLRPLDMIARAGELLPRGGLLSEEVWERRHRAIVVLLVVHAAVIAALVISRGYDPLHTFSEGSVVGVAAIAAAVRRYGRRIRSMIASFGLLSASAILVHLSGGYIEMHFHFFVMIIVISLYQDWWPFLLAVGYVVVHHGVVGAIAPESVYNHPAAVANPWAWAGVHGAFLLGASVASMGAWRLNEQLIDQRERDQRETTLRLRTLLDQEAAAHAAADRATRAKDEFFDRASHELRTPLNAIVGFTQLLRERSAALSDQDRRYLERVQQAGNSLAILLDQVLELADLETRSDFQLQVIDAATFLGPVWESARATSAARDVSCRLTADTPGIGVRAQPQRLRDALAELTNAAIDLAGAGGSMTLASTVEGAHLVVEIATSGSIPAGEDVARLFDPFPPEFDAGSEEARPSRLELAIAHRVVTLHGGSLVAERAAAGGTLIRLVLPVERGITLQ